MPFYVTQRNTDMRYPDTKSKKFSSFKTAKSFCGINVCDFAFPGAADSSLPGTQQNFHRRLKEVWYLEKTVPMREMKKTLKEYLKRRGYVSSSTYPAKTLEDFICDYINDHGIQLIPEHRISAKRFDVYLKKTGIEFSDAVRNEFPQIHLKAEDDLIRYHTYRSVHFHTPEGIAEIEALFEKFVKEWVDRFVDKKVKFTVNMSRNTHDAFMREIDRFGKPPKYHTEEHLKKLEAERKEANAQALGDISIDDFIGGNN